MSAYYNEIDPFAVAWLRELIKAGHIAPGEVDERSIEQVEPKDLQGFTQCHFFAGIGVWSYALRNAGWPDDEPVWTGSCPCPPFSSAGKQKACPQCDGTNPVPHIGRTGYFVCCLCDHEWFADARHLWPEMWRLISLCRPDKFFGEQVASCDGRTWLASIRASLEILEYAFGATDICSAGLGASDIRQRLYFVADANGRRQSMHRPTLSSQSHSFISGETGRLEHAALPARTRQQQQQEHVLGAPSRISKLDDSFSLGRRESGNNNGGDERDIVDATCIPCGLELSDAKRLQMRESDGQVYGPVVESGETLGPLAHANGPQSGDGELQRGGRLLQLEENPLTGFWSSAEWIYCRDGKFRPVEPGTFPLAHGSPARVGRLRGYGNAINAEVAKAFIEAYLSI